MPVKDRFDATVLDAVGTRLARSSSAAREASYELLAHYADTGDAPTQRAVDIMIDNAADALRALTDSFADTSRVLQAAAGCAATFKSVEADGSSARNGRRRDHFA
jgi:hypothetical protein